MIDALYAAAAPTLRGWLDENRARVVAVSQRVAYARGGGSTAVTAAAPKPLKLIALDAGFYDVEGEPIRVRKDEGRTWSAHRGSHAFTEWKAYGVEEPYPVVASSDTLAGLKKLLALYLSDRDAGTLSTLGRYIGGDNRRPAPVVGTPKPPVTEPAPVEAPARKPDAVPALDAAHAALLGAFRLFPRHPFGGEGVRTDFGPSTLNALMERWDFPDEAKRAIVWVPPPGMSAPSKLISPAQVKAVRDTLVEEGTLIVVKTTRGGTPTAWAFTPSSPRFSTRDAYAAALRALFDAPPPTPPVKAPTPPVEPPKPVTPPAPPRSRTLTTTTWTMLDEGRAFPAKFPGTDLISGLPFNAGAEVRSATVNGVKGYVSTAGLRLLDVRYAGDGLSTSVYTIVTPDVDTDALIDRAQRVQLLKKQGGYSAYALEPYGWVSTLGSPTTATPAQIKRYARNAYAIFATGLA